MANIFTNLGKGITAAAVVALAAPPKFIMWGTGSGQGATATGLATAAAPTTTTAVTGTITNTTVSVTNDTVQVVGTVTAAGTVAITEAATTTNATIASGSMFQYGDFSAINLSSGDSIQFTFKLTYS